MSRLRIEVSEYATISLVVVEALAAARSGDVTDLEPPLFDHPDPDALDRLYSHIEASGAPWRFEFATAALDVTVRRDGLVSVGSSPADAAARRPPATDSGK